jgi:hypothetical protein
MRSAYNPTPEQLREWAASPDAEEPVQDWDLWLSHLPHEILYLELAADWNCPARQYFLELLYLIVGDAVRTGFRERSEGEVLDLLERSRAFKHPDLGAWRHRSRALLRNPETFDYAAWCAGGLARSAE